MQHAYRIALAIALAILIGPPATECQTQPAAPSDEIAIKQPALDYIEGWYEGDAARMERALHPELAKRMVSAEFKGPEPTDPDECNDPSTEHARWRWEPDAEGPAAKGHHYPRSIQQRGRCEDCCFRLGGLP
jgi:hypothetical protein